MAAMLLCKQYSLSKELFLDMEHSSDMGVQFYQPELCWNRCNKGTSWDDGFVKRSR